jgi:hypothetical protein
MQTTRMSAFDAPRTTAAAGPDRPTAAVAPVSTAAQSPKTEAPLISDDLFASFNKPAGPPAAPAFDPMKTQKLPPGSERTQRIDVPLPERTQRLDTSPEKTQRIDPGEARRAADGDKTQKIPKFDPSYKPGDTQQLEPSPDATAIRKIEPPGASVAEQTQRLDDSIWRLQEAKRILQGVREKS